ncbi:MAG: DUF5908 family protein [Bacteroidota bacterium]
MPLEVRELIIKAQVGNDTNSRGPLTNASPGHSGQEAMIKQCVEKVLEILKEKAER